MGIMLSELINKLEIDNSKITLINEKEFDNFARMTTRISSKCTFISDSKYVSQIDDTVKMIITSRSVYENIKLLFKNVGFCLYSDPKNLYFELLNISEKTKKKVSFNTRIGENCSISNTAIISAFNVVIGNNVSIEDNVKIEPNVVIGNDCIIKTGTCIGVQDYNLYDFNGKSKQIYHNGMTIIGNNVFIGCNCVIGQALYSYGETVIGDRCKINHNVLIGHNDNIGENNKICKGTILAGYVTTGRECFFGIGSMVRNSISIGEYSTVGMGTVVVKTVPNGVTVIGNPAHSI